MYFIFKSASACAKERIVCGTQCIHIIFSINSRTMRNRLNKLNDIITLKGERTNEVITK